MSQKSLAKTSDEVYMDLIAQFRSIYGPDYKMEDVGQWIDDNDLLPKPKVSAVRIFTRNCKQAARRNRFVDAQGRKVRSMVPAKFEAVDANNNRLIEVVWNHLHESSKTHLLTHFSQRDETIDKQKSSASRDLQSALDNNPNIAGCASQFQFGFMREEPAEQVVQGMSESEIVIPRDQPLPKPEKRKPR